VEDDYDVSRKAEHCIDVEEGDRVALAFSVLTFVCIYIVQYGMHTIQDEDFIINQGVH